MIYDIELNSAAHYPVAGIVELSPLIEQAGFGAFWKGESNSTDPLILLSGIAARTRTLKLGTAIYHIYGRSAVTLGVQSATLQDLSGGRLLLGLGVANKTIASWHGGTFDRPLRRAREYIDIVRKTAAGRYQHTVTVRSRNAARVGDRADPAGDENAGPERAGRR